MALRVATASATVRACGPTVSCVWEIGTTPPRLTMPIVGLIPTTAFTFAGQTMLPSVSLPRLTAVKLEAAAAAEPELEPQGFRSVGDRREPQRVRVQLEDAVDVRTGLVERADAIEIELRELHRGEPTRGHLRLQLRDRELVVRGGRRGCRARRERCGAGRDDGWDQQDDRDDREHVPRHVV